MKNLQYADGHMRPASKYGLEDVSETLILTDEEMKMSESIRESWKGILNCDVADDTDFFKSGAGSMDVVRSEPKDHLSLRCKQAALLVARYSEIL